MKGALKDAPALMRRRAKQLAFGFNRIAKQTTVWGVARVKRRLSGEVLRARTRGLRNSVEGELGSSGGNLVLRFSVGNARIKYARIHEFGGTITPKNKRYLRIPKRKGTPPSNLTVIKSKKGKLLLIQRVKGKNKGILWAILVSSVKIPKREYFYPSMRETGEFLRKGIKQVLIDVADKNG